MYLLAEIFPRLRRVHMPLSRDQAFLALTALNHAFIAIDVYLAHSISGDDLDLMNGFPSCLA